MRARIYVYAHIHIYGSATMIDVHEGNEGIHLLIQMHLRMHLCSPTFLYSAILLHSSLTYLSTVPITSSNKTLMYMCVGLLPFFSTRIILYRAFSQSLFLLLYLS